MISCHTTIQSQHSLGYSRVAWRYQTHTRANFECPQVESNAIHLKISYTEHIVKLSSWNMLKHTTYFYSTLKLSSVFTTARPRSAAIFHKCLCQIWMILILEEINIRSNLIASTVPFVALHMWVLKHGDDHDGLDQLLNPLAPGGYEKTH